MDYLYSSAVDSLVFDSAVEPIQFDQEAADELALWTNAEFTFDMQPGQGLLDDLAPKTSDHRSAEKYAQYLELLQQTTQQLPPAANNYPAILPMPQQQRLLPKPISTLPPASMTLPSQQKQQMEVDQANEDNTAAKQSRPSLEDKQETHVVEDDKRRRNTAASARFRLKKKVREQQMEQTVREMTEKSERLEDRARELELEIKWLRSLLIEKGVNISGDRMSS
ncbi:hypothetical protein DFQ28_006653 [Apophysomyces sp. BC1034]|nr:hypothetical protein DFQ30_004677 [Apophysomyces sp. BC1015]KAG0193059.1 hypothetical protein DFQ28_006653 [Apophysomyces sp. BC1034]